MDQHCISIIIPVYNGERTIIESIDSLLKQDYIEKNPSNIEIIVINDNSTDNSYSLVNKYFYELKLNIFCYFSLYVKVLYL